MGVTLTNRHILANTNRVYMTIPICLVNSGESITPEVDVNHISDQFRAVVDAPVIIMLPREIRNDESKMSVEIIYRRACSQRKRFGAGPMIYGK